MVAFGLSILVIISIAVILTPPQFLVDIWLPRIEQGNLPDEGHGFWDLIGEAILVVADGVQEGCRQFLTNIQRIVLNSDIICAIVRWNQGGIFVANLDIVIYIVQLLKLCIFKIPHVIRLRP